MREIRGNHQFVELVSNNGTGNGQIKTFGGLLCKISFLCFGPEFRSTTRGQQQGIGKVIGLKATVHGRFKVAHEECFFDNVLGSWRHGTSSCCLVMTIERQGLQGRNILWFGRQKLLRLLGHIRCRKLQMLQQFLSRIGFKDHSHKAPRMIMIPTRRCPTATVLERCGVCAFRFGRHHSRRPIRILGHGPNGHPSRQRQPTR